jgi:hypothetical protein
VTGNTFFTAAVFTTGASRSTSKVNVCFDRRRNCDRCGESADESDADEAEARNLTGATNPVWS